MFSKHLRKVILSKTNYNTAEFLIESSLEIGGEFKLYCINLDPLIL